MVWPKVFLFQQLRQYGRRYWSSLTIEIDAFDRHSKNQVRIQGLAVNRHFTDQPGIGTGWVASPKINSVIQVIQAIEEKNGNRGDTIGLKLVEEKARRKMAYWIVRTKN